MKKLLCLALALCMAVSLAIVPAAASEETTAVPNESQAAQVQIGNTTYTVAFYLGGSNGEYGLFVNGQGPSREGDETPDPNAGFELLFDVNIGAFLWDESDGEYKLANDITVQINNMAIHSDDGIFSFSDSGLVTEQDGPASALYARRGNPGEAVISANVTVSDGSTSEPATVYWQVSVLKYEAPQFAFYTSSDGGEANRIDRNMDVCYYTLPTQGTVWLIADADVEDLSSFDVYVNNTKQELTWQNNAAQITLPEPTYNQRYWVEANYGRQHTSFPLTSRPVSSAVEYNGYIIGFSSGGSRIFDNRNSLMEVSDKAAATDNFVEFTNALEVVAQDNDGNEVRSVNIEVHGMSIRQFSGEANSFSFSPDETLLTSNGDRATLYYRDGSAASAIVTADITIDGRPDVTVSLAVETRRTGLKFYTSGTLDANSYIPVNSFVSYYSLTNGELWLTSDQAFDFDKLELRADGQEISYDKVDSNTIKITLAAPTDDYGYYLNVSTGSENVGISINRRPYGSCIRITIGENDYIAGFGFDYGDDATIINEGNWEYANSTSESPDPENERYEFRDLTVNVGLKQYDAEGEAYYLVDRAGPLHVQVRSMEIQTLYGCEGYGDTFSFSQDAGAAVLTTSSFTNNTAKVYVKRGYDATALAIATVDVYSGSQLIESGTVSVTLRIDRVLDTSFERPADDTVEALNAAIAGAAAQLPEDGQGTLSFFLNAEKYEGTIVLPEDLLDYGDYDICLIANDRTTIVGGIDLNGSAAVLDALDFVAPADSSGVSALSNGRAQVDRCTFQGYDVAIDANRSTINPRYCVFADNGIAVRLNIYEQHNGSISPWEGNVFINNDIAVQALQLNSLLSPYYFRIVDSNFVNNDVTFDVQCPGTIYFYRNYYGITLRNMTSAEILDAIKGSHQLLNAVINMPPIVKVAPGGETRVITNPRWIFPIFRYNDRNYPDLQDASALSSSGSGGAVLFLASADEQANTGEEENYLTIDWDLPTEIVNSESENLIIDASAFAEATDTPRVIDVVDEGGKLLGTWNLGTEAHPNLTGNFDARITVTRDGSAVNVSVQADPTILAELKPTLTIPDATGGVQQGDTGVPSSESESGSSVSFVVSSGGNYVISPEIEETPTTPEEPGGADEPDTPDEPVNPGTPGRPSEPDTPDEPSEPFTDVAANSWYYDAVVYVYNNGLMDGVSNTLFNPDGEMTRAMVWAILARIDGETITGSNWVSEAQSWAVASGVSDGTDANGAVTREQLVTMLWRFAGEPETDATLSAWSDAASVSDWAEAAMAWAVDEGVITGVGASTIDPMGGATRAQCATILMRSIDKI